VTERDYERGFHDGWVAFQFRMDREQGQGASPYYKIGAREERFYGLDRERPNPTKPKPKKGKDPTPTLTKMTAPIWKRYKAGSGKKTYFDIRNQVRRSVKYKRAKKTRGA